MSIRFPTQQQVLDSTTSSAGGSRSIDPEVVNRRGTDRWRGIAGLALLAFGIGLLTGEPGLILISSFGIGYGAFGKLVANRTPSIDLDRTISEADPRPGSAVTVSVSLTNESNRMIRDLRFIDGVPPGVRVVDGSPRFGTSLRPNETATFTYTIDTVTGTHRFQPSIAITRDWSGQSEHVTGIETPTTFTCTPRLPERYADVPLRRHTSQYIGHRTADDGGTGVEFYSTREYQSGDPLKRIDWRRTARTGELSTVEYRRELAASVMLVVDCRRRSYLAADPHAESAVRRSVDAVLPVAASLFARGNSVGLTALSPASCWLEPDRGSDHQAVFTSTLATHPAFDPVPPEDDFRIISGLDRIRSRLPGHTQVIFFTPFCDDGAYVATIRFEANGHPTSIVSPDPTATDTVGRRMSAIERAVRIRKVRQRGIPIVDWKSDEPFELAIDRTMKWWSR